MHKKTTIISLEVNNVTFSEGLQKVTEAGLKRQPGFVCFANVHMVVEAYKSESFKKDLEKATYIFPDGKPLALYCRWFNKTRQERIAGMDFMPALLKKADEHGAKVFFYGSTQETLTKIEQHIKQAYPRAVFAGAIAPPFQLLTDTEINQHIQQINDSGAQFVLVALGCPKQEKWMAAHYQSIQALLLGVGGAFPVVAGVRKRSPQWMQRFALEWLYRLLQEPGRMLKRYLYTNIYFIGLVIKQALQRTFF
jgi:N-acetylglucosaminyldiphosphoundecaprenol N-acetyl-beta-D-mannosaminyltransferase